jgi:7-cyano-7-deazaguanine synthase
MLRPLSGAGEGEGNSSRIVGERRMSQQSKSAVVLLSGGLDSTTTLAIAKHEGFRLHALTFQYGQRHAIEIAAARRVAQAIGVERHVIVDIDLRLFGGSALTEDLAVPKNRTQDEISEGIPITYVPARNTVFLAYALAFAEVTGSEDIFIGVNALDYSGYPDCRPEFIQAFEAMANLATKAAIEGHQRLQIHTPLMQFSKAQIVQRGRELGVDFGLTHSCYDPSPDGSSCGQCDSCLMRLKGFAEAGLADPIAYRALPQSAR